jgi:outer membrane protein, heavy metal efflux system
MARTRRFTREEDLMPRQSTARGRHTPPRCLSPGARLALALLWLAAPALAASERPPTAATGGPAAQLEALIAEAVDRSPALAAARAELAARVAEQGAAGALPDPMVEAMLQNAGLEWTVGSMEMAMLGAAVRQELPHPAKRSAERRLARAWTGGAGAELEHRVRQVVQEVRQRYGRLYAIDRELESLAAARELVDLLEATARGRYSAGESGAAALLRAQLERTRVDERTADLRTARATVAAELNGWLGRPGQAPVEPVGELPEVTFDAALVAVVADTSTEAARGSAALEVAAAELERRRADLRPDLVPVAGIGWRGDLEPIITLGVDVSFPFWRRDKQLPRIAAAEHELAARAAELTDARLAAVVEATALAAAFANADEQLQRYREGIVPQSAAVFDAARSAYLSGRTDFGEALEAFGLWLDARVGLARREADRFAAWAGLAHLAESRGHASGELP